MTSSQRDLVNDAVAAPERYVEDVAALVHFSSYIAREAKRLGFPGAAEKARVIECEFLSALGRRDLANDSCR